MNFNNKQNINKFFQTKPMKCSYLSERFEKRLIMSIKYNKDNHVINKLTTLGFRRNLDFMYLPICNNCSECISSRISVTNFRASKSQKRNLKRNSHFRFVKMIDNAKKKRYENFQEYISTRHEGSQMQKMTQQEFSNFLYNTPTESSIFDLIDESNNIVASILLDQLDNGMSAVYSFYKPKYLRDGLGIYLILKAIEQVKLENKKYLYLGYWVKNSRKMNYKIQFDNLQIFTDGSWKFVNQ